MDKNEQVMANVRDLFNKLAWINKVKMEKSARGIQTFRSPLYRIYCQK